MYVLWKVLPAMMCNSPTGPQPLSRAQANMERHRVDRDRSTTYRRKRHCKCSHRKPQASAPKHKHTPRDLLYLCVLVLVADSADHLSSTQNCATSLWHECWWRRPAFDQPASLLHELSCAHKAMRPLAKCARAPRPVSVSLCGRWSTNCPAPRVDVATAPHPAQQETVWGPRPLSLALYVFRQRVCASPRACRHHRRRRACRCA